MKIESEIKIIANNKIFYINDNIKIFMNNGDLITASINGFKDGYLQVLFYNTESIIEIPMYYIKKIEKI